MDGSIQFRSVWQFTSAGLALLWLIVACSGPVAAPSASLATQDAGRSIRIHSQSLPELAPLAASDGTPLRVVATTNIIADVVANIGGEHIELFGLIPTGSDPHGFSPTPQDLQRLNDAHVVLINGLGLEESLLPFLEELDSNAPIISVNIGVETVEFGGSRHDHDRAASNEGERAGMDLAQEAPEEEEHDEDHRQDVGIDPHTWFSVHSVEQWVDNIEQILSALDPTNTEAYAANAMGYRVQLAELEQELDALVAQLASEQRKLVTDHDSFGYFANDYAFKVVGTVVPALSTMASPSAGDLAALQAQIQAEAIPAIFVGTTINPDLAQTIAADMGIQVVSIYTGSLSEQDGPAGNYIDFMRYNVTTIVTALQ